jgi:hypothetical protein
MRTQKQLFDGRTVDSYSEEWREQCEAQTILNMPTRGARWAYIRGVEDRRGEAASMRLQAIMVNLMPTERQRAGIINALMYYRNGAYTKAFIALLKSPEFQRPAVVATEQIASLF